ncbi:hypothetical protein HYT57_02675 [Candidatus Woesearchaeota archaeon]|nr:hypothetical protein [Candidatus Woesearchaeota archaeon]
MKKPIRKRIGIIGLSLVPLLGCGSGNNPVSVDSENTNRISNLQDARAKLARYTDNLLLEEKIDSVLEGFRTRAKPVSFEDTVYDARKVGGDFNYDHNIYFDDFYLFVEHFGSSGEESLSDVNEDGKVDSRDFTDFNMAYDYRNNFDDYTSSRFDLNDDNVIDISDETILTDLYEKNGNLSVHCDLNFYVESGSELKMISLRGIDYNGNSIFDQSDIEILVRNFGKEIYTGELDRDELDLNKDGAIDGKDFSTFSEDYRRNFGRTLDFDLYDYDINGDSRVDFDDFFIFADNFGKTVNERPDISRIDDKGELEIDRDIEFLVKAHDLERDNLTYKWFVGGEVVFGMTSDKLVWRFDQPGDYEISVIATDEYGGESSLYGDIFAISDRFIEDLFNLYNLRVPSRFNDVEFESMSLVNPSESEGISNVGRFYDPRNFDSSIQVTYGGFGLDNVVLNIYRFNSEVEVCINHRNAIQEGLELYSSMGDSVHSIGPTAISEDESNRLNRENGYFYFDSGEGSIFGIIFNDNDNLYEILYPIHESQEALDLVKALDKGKFFAETIARKN